MKTTITALLCAGVVRVCGQNTFTEFEIAFTKKSHRFPDEMISTWYAHTENMYATDTIFIEAFEPLRTNDELSSLQFQRMENISRRIREEGCVRPVIMTNVMPYDKEREIESCYVRYRGGLHMVNQASNIPVDEEVILVDDRGWRVKCLQSQRKLSRNIEVLQSSSYEDLVKLGIFKQADGTEYLQMITISNIEIPRAYKDEPITLMIPTAFKRSEQLVYYEVVESSAGKILCEESKAKLKKYDDTYFWVVSLDHSASLCLGKKLISDEKITFEAPEGMVIQDAKMIIAGTNSFLSGTISGDQMTVEFPKSPLWKNAQVSFVYEDLKGITYPIEPQLVGNMGGMFNFNSNDVIPLSMNK